MRYLLITLFCMTWNHAFAVDLDGRTEFSQRIAVNSSISARIESIHTSVGKRVTAGDVLVRLKNTELQVNVDIARAEIAALLPTVEQMATELDKAQELYDRDSLAQVELEIAEQNHAIAVARLEAAQGRLTRALFRLSQAEIRAPIDGLILQLQAYPGQYLNILTVDHSLLTIVNSATMHARALLPLENWRESLPGHEALVQYGGQRFPAQVVEVGREVISGPNNHPSLLLLVKFKTNREMAAGLPVQITIDDD